MKKRKYRFFLLYANFSTLCHFLFLQLVTYSTFKFLLLFNCLLLMNVGTYETSSFKSIFWIFLSRNALIRFPYNVYHPSLFLFLFGSSFICYCRLVCISGYWVYGKDPVLRPFTWRILVFSIFQKNILTRLWLGRKGTGAKVPRSHSDLPTWSHLYKFSRCPISARTLFCCRFQNGHIQSWSHKVKDWVIFWPFCYNENILKLSKMNANTESSSDLCRGPFSATKLVSIQSKVTSIVNEVAC